MFNFDLSDLVTNAAAFFNGLSPTLIVLGGIVLGWTLAGILIVAIFRYRQSF